MSKMRGARMTRAIWTRRVGVLSSWVMEMPRLRMAVRPEITVRRTILAPRRLPRES